MSYSIGMISIQNFKHIENLQLNLRDINLIVLNGPNGFGKTTIFDAIELVLNHKISRIVNTRDGQYGYEKLLLIKDENKDTIIKVEFYKQDDAITIVKKFDSTKKRKTTDNKPDNWAIFETYYLNNFEDELLAKNFKKPEELHVIKEISKYFNWFYYIQQEENIAFLKKNAKTRMSEISALFDTELEQKQKKILEEARTKIIQHHTHLNQKLTEKRKSLEDMTNNSESKEYEKIEYFPLIPESTFALPWDKPIENLQFETKNMYLKELRMLYKLKSESQQFLYAKNNLEIEEYAENIELLKQTIILASFLEKIEDFRQLNTIERKLTSLLEKINQQRLIKDLNSFPFEEVEEYIQDEGLAKLIRSNVSSLLNQKANMNNLSSLVQELNSTRNILTNQFNEFLKRRKEEEKNCPLCGVSQNSHEELLKRISEKSNLISSHYDNFSKEYEEHFNRFYEEIISPINKKIVDYLQNEEKIINKDFYSQLLSYNQHVSSVKLFLEWCSKKEISIFEFINHKNNMVSKEDIEVAVIQIAERIRKVKNPVDIEYEESGQTFKEVNYLYNNVLDGDQKKLENISLEIIERKAKYINYQYYINATNAVLVLNKDISELEQKIKKIKNLRQNLKDIIKVYEDKILAHWKRIIKSIEIPFYIYSGKILQDYQKGRGIFIKVSDKDNEKTISFVAGSESDQDVINYFSSGQLSAMIIAFTLSLNKTYSNKAMDVLLIDDPVQTMDEVNMASFVEVLRNDFKEKQIIMSTHEEDVARYMRYKFKKYNLQTKNINIKDEIYN